MDKVLEKNQNIHFVFSTFLSEKCAVCEIMWKNLVELDMPHVTI